MKKITLKITTMILMALTFSFVVQAQWTDNPLQNNLLSGADSTYSYGEFRVNPIDSSYYLFYYHKVADSALNYALYLKKYNFHGVSQWGELGLLIDDAPNKTWVPGVDIAFSNDSRIYLGYTSYTTDTITGDDVAHIHLNALTLSGEKLWGNHGIEISNPESYADFGITLLVTDEQNLLASYEQYFKNEELQIDMSFLVTKQYSPQGELQWSYSPPIEDKQYQLDATLVKTEGRNMCVYKQDQVTVINDTTTMFDQVLMAQQFDEAGTPLFAHPKLLFTYNHYFNDPPMMPYKLTPDNNGGFYLASFYAEHITADFQLFVQRMDPYAEPLFYPNPVPVAIRFGVHIERADFDMACFKDSPELLIVWVEREGMGVDATERIVGQKISQEGVRRWGIEGMEIYPPLYTIDEKYGWVNVKQASDGNNLIFHLDYLSEDQSVKVIARKIDEDGNKVWTDDAVLSSSDSEKRGLDVTEEIDGQWVATWNKHLEWMESGIHNVDILYGQNITSRGSIGTGIFAWSKASIDFNLFPNPARDRVQLEIQSTTNERAQITVLNTAGQKVIQVESWPLYPGSNAYTLPVQSLKSGLYVVQVKLGTGMAAAKLQVY